ncbi:DUF4340 domain-containing protein [candidate division KSB1 bacterium]
MNEKQKTLYFGGAAILLALLAIVTAPGHVTPDAFLDQGELFFPDFQDPNEAETLEVIDYDPNTGTAIPFKVTFSGTNWTIPSHHNYAADGKDRLSKTAAGVIGITKDDIRSDNVSDHELCGVIDPLDETVTTLKGRGKRVTMKGVNDKVLADFIVGNTVENREGFRFVRVPGQKRIYAVRMNIDLSTNFADWIEADLLKVDKAKINKVVLMDYSINERTQRIESRDQVELTKKDDVWSQNNMPADQVVDEDKISTFLTTLDELSIVGVRSKPEGLSATLMQSEGQITVSQSDQVNLQGKGFYFTNDGSLRSNEGEMQAQTDDGLTYTLRFGEIVYGSGLAVSAGTEEAGEEASGENRYLFITTNFDRNYFQEPGKPADFAFRTKPDSTWTDTDKRNKEINDIYEQWQGKVDNGAALSKELNDRFAKWYYVISAESFDKLNLTRTDFLKAKEEEVIK